MRACYRLSGGTESANALKEALKAPNQPGGHCKRTPADHMHMQVVDGLSGASIAVDDGAIAIAAMPSCSRHLGRGQEQPADQFGIGIVGVVQRRDRFSRDDQHMGRRLRVEIAKGNKVLVFVDDIAGTSPAAILPKMVSVMDCCSWSADG
jgi:hypothetical protein